MMPCQIATDAEHVPVRMTQMKLANAPGFVRRRICNHGVIANCQFMKTIHFSQLLNPPAHPDSICLIVAGKSWHDRATRTLSSNTKKNL